MQKMAKTDKELKPLLDKNSSQQENQQQPTPIPLKKHGGAKSKTTISKPKLFSVTETSVESDHHQHLSKEELRCRESSEKDVDETDSQNLKQRKNHPPTQSTLSPHPPQSQVQSTSSAEQQQYIDDGHGGKVPAFGVKSNLHHFYESVSQTPTQDENYQYLIHPKGTSWGALWFKIGLIIGATLFLLGAVAIVIGYAIPKQRVIIGKSENMEVIDNDARRFNENLDRCKLIGLAGFCSGGLILVISLLAPTFTSTYWEEDPATEPFRVSLSNHILGFSPGNLEQVPSDPNHSPIPVTEKIKCIQPVWTD